ncbi:MAG: DUF2062 domain-containing protein [Gammaproteobacteria bacterium]
MTERFFRVLAYYIRANERLILNKLRMRPDAPLAKFIHADLIRFTRTRVCRGMSVGMFWAFVPMPFQMVPAVLFCWLARANAPVALVCVWISNPFTYLPIFSAQYQIGAWLFGGEDGGWNGLRVLAENGEVWELLKTAGPVFYQGALATSVFMSAAGYAAGRIMFYYLEKRNRRKVRLARKAARHSGTHAHPR